MKAMHEHDVSKLPQWAQRKISTADANKKYYEQKIRELGGEVESDTHIRRGIDKEDIPLPAGTMVVFTTEDGDEISACVDSDGVRVRGTGLSSGCIEVLPQASNSVVVRGRKP
jgi:hypothetical protein